MINKPISVKRVDFINSLSQLTANSGLQPYVLEPIFEKMAEDMKLLTKQQYKNDLQAYQKSCKGGKTSE